MSWWQLTLWLLDKIRKKSIPPPPEKIPNKKVQNHPYRRIFEDNRKLAFQWKMEVKDSIIIANGRQDDL